MEWKFVEEECHGFLDARDRHLVVHLFYSILLDGFIPHDLLHAWNHGGGKLDFGKPGKCAPMDDLPGG